MTREIQLNALDMNCVKRRLPDLSAQPLRSTPRNERQKK